MASETVIQASVLYGAKDLRTETLILPPLSPTELQVAIRSTTLCGSDLHYYNHARNGDILVRAPLSLGHESSGVVVAVGSSVTNFTCGDRVALEVGIPCGDCPRCLEGRYNICPTLRFRSSAKSVPHFWGTLQERINHPAKWCHKLPETVSYTMASLLEPLGVAIHCTRRAARGGGLVAGGKVLVIGAGAVGCLVAAMGKMGGATRVGIADINAGRVEFAKRQGWASHGYVSIASTRLETVEERLAAAKKAAGEMLAAVGCEEGVDAVFECTGMETCVQTGIYACRPGGTLMLIGMGTPVQTLPISAAALREVDILGGFRYAGTYETGIELLGSGRLNGVEKLVTQTFSGLDGVDRAFKMAGRQKDDDEKLVIKVEVLFGDGE